MNAIVYDKNDVLHITPDIHKEVKHNITKNAMNFVQDLKDEKNAIFTNAEKKKFHYLKNKYTSLYDK